MKNIENAEQLLASNDVNDILLPLDEWIAMNGFDENYALTDEGREAQRIYDSLYAKNV
jgi:hypothetical protein